MSSGYKLACVYVTVPGPSSPVSKLSAPPPAIGNKPAEMSGRLSSETACVYRRRPDVSSGFLHRHPAVHHQGLPCHIASRWARQEKSGAGDVLRVAQTTEGNLLQQRRLQIFGEP